MHKLGHTEFIYMKYKI